VGEQQEPVDRERARACLLGGALGDALGYPLEFMRHTEIVERYGAATPAALIVGTDGLSLVSDDTQMTLFSAEALLDERTQDAPSLACCFAAYRRWLATQTHQIQTWSGWRGTLGLIGEPRLGITRAPGNTCLDVLASADPTIPPSLASPPNQSKGCGAIMRAAPFGLAPLSRAQAFLVSRDAALLTHGHPAGYLPAAVFTALVWGLTRGETLAAALDASRALLALEPGANETALAIDEALALAERGTPSARELGLFGDRAAADGRRTRGGGWTGDAALGIALAIALAAQRDGTTAGAEGFAEATWQAAAHDGDSDSTAALTGQLLGAQRGTDALPAGWLATLELRALIERSADGVVAP